MMFEIAFSYNIYPIHHERPRQDDNFEAMFPASQHREAQLLWRGDRPRRAASEEESRDRERERERERDV